MVPTHAHHHGLEWHRLLDGPNRASLMRMMVMASLAMLLSAAAPPPVVPAMLATMLFFGSLASLIVAFLAREMPFEEHLTRWDEAAVLLGLSMVSSMFVDPELLAATGMGR